MLLPFMEMTARYNEFLAHNDDADFNIVRINDKASHQFASESVSVLNCPSDSNVKNFCPAVGGDAGRQVTQCNLVISRGDGMCHTEHDYGGPSKAADYGTWSPRSRSMFNRRDWKGINSCTDGTSQTIAVSETATINSLGSKNVIGGIRVSTVGMQVSGNHINCANARNGTELTGTMALAVFRGGSWMFGCAAWTGFHTVNPPNTPACIRNDTYIDWGLFPPSSRHPGGVNSAFFDGSGRFMSETIDFGGSSAEQVFDGESQFGVWGSLGTPSGGETKSAL
jgi:prepilin-type processing-associated H-X9-DG protein